MSWHSKILTNPDFNTSKILHWLPVAFRIDFKILLFTFKCIHNLSPEYLSELVVVRDTGRILRSSEGILLDVPKTRTKTFGDRAFANCAPRLWNDLPLAIRSAESVQAFKTALKTHMFTLAFEQA